MRVLYNGEYGEYSQEELGTPNLTTNMKVMEENYSKWPGTVVGDFTCLNVEYDWGRHDQRWTVQCNLCGEVSYRYHVQDWRRGKGQRTSCHCRQDAKNAEKEREKERRKEEKELRQKAEIGKEYFGWKVIEYNGFQKCTIECTTCGTIRKCRRIDDVKSGINTACTHRKPKDYSGNEWIGKKEGHLTTIGRDGMMFIAQCDCGEVIRVRPTDIFTSKRKRACSSPNCPYCNEQEKISRERHTKGFEYERNITELLRQKGYNAKKTQDIADFGVDVIIEEADGTKMAVQCKKQTIPTGIESIQEVYAGGRFYDCEKFAVICESGFSKQAVTMAQKLGVYCCNGDFEPPTDIDAYAQDLLPTHIVTARQKTRKLYELDGEVKTLTDWCAIYGKRYSSVKNLLKNGVTLETALKCDFHKRESKKKFYTAFGETGTLQEICEKNNVLAGTVSYRMRTYNMTIEEAILAKPRAKGRPRKKHPADRQITQSANT